MPVSYINNKKLNLCNNFLKIEIWILYFNFQLLKKIINFNYFKN